MLDGRVPRLASTVANSTLDSRLDHRRFHLLPRALRLAAHGPHRCRRQSDPSSARLMFVGLAAGPNGLGHDRIAAGVYPYCGMRVLAFMTPAICLFAAAGIAPINAWLWRRHPASVLLTWIVLALPFGHSLYRIQNPWQRTDTAGSTNYVMAHWQTGDQIGFNFWEGEYYFRHLATNWLNPARPVPSTTRRIWYVATANILADREQVLSIVPHGWQMAERRDFKNAIVALYVPPAAVSDSVSASTP